MNNALEERIGIMRDSEGQSQQFEARRRVAKDLKRCPLCGAINAFGNDECFVCSWHGTFATDQGSVDEGLDELFVRCPELFDALFDGPSEPQGIRAWFIAFFAKLRECRRPRRMRSVDWG